MIVIGVDTHKRSHTAAAVGAATARTIAEQTVNAKRRSFDDLLTWARALEAPRPREQVVERAAVGADGLLGDRPRGRAVNCGRRV